MARPSGAVRVGADAFLRPAKEASAPDECVRGYMTRRLPQLRGRDALATAGKMPALQNRAAK